MKRNALALLFFALPLIAAPPRLANGTVQTVAALAQAPTSGWVGYAITANRTFSTCGCRLSSDNDGMTDVSRGPSPALIFVHWRDGQPARVRVFSPNCEIDASGESVTWAENVSQSESVAYLQRAIDTGTERARGSALFALSMQAGGTDALIDVARHNASSHLRGQALFWLSQQAGERAASALRDAVENDPEESVRSKAVFGIAQLPNDESIPLLIDLLKHNRSREVRKKAAFWLGQKNDPRALAAFEEILRQ